ncbi:MAG: 3-hydroxyacyl-CoA dehydrogenase [Deltaproteobacteria bacterium]|nr:3-hydroxyacyl-CoA dehydrogenase [Deltaproteobacteria bacterium]MBW2051480.1 3-hydroxyacyl-CoA dehydrogenase [Deltaproteobacteria bacterium]MBW2140590.1 3-hydroxyacyl-CoA dehydrogenase [Deltaproteobacteria bacterium]MBW2324283.1 3-hydroxyacyl-CoA dehydrogenase [Deltaproteobacteria bacterium]
MTIEEIKKVCFVGAGTMGCFNSMVTGIAGYDAVVYDVSPEALKHAPERQREIGAHLIETGVLTQDVIDAGLTHITFTEDPKEAVEEADLLSESVFERLELKRETHKQFDEICPPRMIQTTNTSSLLVSDIESAVKRGDRFAALHFHLMASFVDIAGGPRTSPETIDILKRFARSLGQTPIVLKKEKAGYLHNTMLGAFLNSALMLVIDDYADIRDVDRSWMLAHQGQAGPFVMIDGIGLNVLYDAAMEGAKDAVFGEAAQKVVDFMRPYIERGDLGAKTGKGFYTYPDPEWQKPEFLSGEE